MLYINNNPYICDMYKKYKELNDIMCGDYDDKIGLEYLEKAKHIGFLLSNFSIDIDTDHSIFDYEGIVIKIGGIRSALNSGALNMLEDDYELEFENYLISLFTKQEDFLRAYKMFERSYKINTIIK
jgi:hypothetical protein